MASENLIDIYGENALRDCDVVGRISQIRRANGDLVKMEESGTSRLTKQNRCEIAKALPTTPGETSSKALLSIDLHSAFDQLALDRKSHYHLSLRLSICFQELLVRR